MKCCENRVAERIAAKAAYIVQQLEKSNLDRRSQLSVHRCSTERTCKPDSAVDEEIAVLQVHCSNSSIGCLWTGDLKDMEEHVSSCDYQPRPCPNKGCGRLISVKKKGHNKTCVFRSVSCQICNQTLMANKLELIVWLTDCMFIMFIIVFQAHYTLCHARKPTMSLSTGENSALFHSLKYAQLSLSPVIPRPAMKPGRVPGFTDFIHQDCLPYRAIPSCIVEQYTLGCENLVPLKSYDLDHPQDIRVCFRSSTAQVDSLGPAHARKRKLVTSSGSSLSSCPMWTECKRQKCFSEGDTSVVDSRERKVKNIKDKVIEIRNQRSELHRQEEELLSELQHAIAGQGDFGALQITKRVYHECITDIQDWIDVVRMLPQLMKHKVISGPDDMYNIINGSPREKLHYLYSKLCGCKNGFQLFYQCLREDDHLGHRDAADKLEETARNIGPGQAHQCSP
ncbi:hypothetical protein GBAR_LOCUS30441 [Geodia barretti]|uniref:RING-type E3 ubiquitin transferase n=1 Tax=Geodia barretti TaxID=519541 RepID=A0AA35TWL0_GEOBA|nr:hypothetical protein GBAR_LOCUS30441 [Geodia barretti]